ncbi:carbon-nitrogen hydrolase family protein [Natrarchaeobius oligotrophus]|uniref:Carbon-nitrogen hydrolase family protein n=1 Tax=Natrarchaeobius chitinivorans TaxID=1679083 RepID=A0A3N6PSQ8_NATCH|nr:carbon-nitrogen hydrolase family protein [Natrarchaeobius chitinivorans]RQH02596.1 carbon-nitrogen hydrolase family protein [Natrarchaeobius chitinivorans]
MSDTRQPVTVAAAHVASDYLDRDGTTEKARKTIAEAGENGADLVVFPESYVPGYPHWIWTHTPTEGAPLFREFSANAVEIPGPTIDELGAAAANAGTHVVCGVTERDGGTLYNTLVYIDDEGDLLGTHRKLQPTHAERTVWGQGDGSDLQTFETAIGTIGGLICWEHTMDLVRYAMTSLGEQIHVAAWPAVSAITHNPHSEIFDDVTEAAARHHALAGQTFVVNVQACVDETAVETLGFEDQPEMFREGGGWSAIIDPEGRILAGPNTDDETILYADIDLEDIRMANQACDSVGHYARPDVVRLLMDRSPQPIVEEFDSFVGQARATPPGESETSDSVEEPAANRYRTSESP